MRLSQKNRAFKLVEIMFTTVLIGVLGLVIYSLLNVNCVLGAKNTAVNTAHQQARVAMLQMVQDLRSSISLPLLTGVSGSQASGISFQQWGSVPVTTKGLVSNGGPHKIIADANVGEDHVHISVTAGPGITATQSKPMVGQRVIIPTHQIEADIIAVSGNTNNFSVTMGNIYGPALTGVTYPVSTLPVEINGTGSSVGDVICIITDRCTYSVSGNALSWTVGTNSARVMANDITNSQGVLYDASQPQVSPNVPPTPFSIPTTPAGSLYYRSVSAIDLSTADAQYNNRGYKAANILLNGAVPSKVRITTYQ